MALLSVAVDFLLIMRLSSNCVAKKNIFRPECNQRFLFYPGATRHMLRPEEDTCNRRHHQTSACNHPADLILDNLRTAVHRMLLFRFRRNGSRAAEWQPPTLYQHLNKTIAPKSSSSSR
jgi:hypothetical protein